MLYIWPFFAFFSAPLLIPYALNIIKSFYNRLTKTTTPDPQNVRERQLESYYLYQTFALLIVTLTIIHFNTIIHPFTLADNRHYVFYVFRYSILRHPSIRYLLSPIYLLCGYLVIRCLSGFQNTPTTETQPTRYNTSSKNQPQIKPNTPSTATPNEISFTLIFVISTALSLITAPLVEPRYFIIPWVIWRLHVPAVKTQFLGKEYDHRLVVETVWFLAINFVTGWVFLFKGFEWVQEPGKVQRFMWWCYAYWGRSDKKGGRGRRRSGAERNDAVDFGYRFSTTEWTYGLKATWTIYYWRSCIIDI